MGYVHPWAIQGWGNGSQRFEEGFLQSMSNHFDGFIADSTGLENLADLQMFKSGWLYVTPTQRTAL